MGTFLYSELKMVSDCILNLIALSATPTVASKTVISPIFFIIPPRPVRERSGLVEFPRHLGSLKLWGLSSQEAGGRVRYVQYLSLIFNKYLTNIILVE
jgi:hypothetical protein